jgi:hypothetical protein
MTAHALALRLRRVLDLLAMAAVTTLRLAHVVLVVAARAGVLRARDDRRIVVAARAAARLEVVRLVAARTGVVANSDRALLFGVAARARCDGLLLVHRMAIDAAVQTCMLGLAAAVAVGAPRPLGRRFTMRFVTTAASFVTVDGDRGHVSLLLFVATHAVPRRDARVRGVAMALRAGWCARECRRILVVQRGGLRVAVLAELGRRLLERLAVTVGARDLADVFLMADCRAHVAPLGRYVPRRVGTIAESTGDEASGERSDDQRSGDPSDAAHRHRAPIG